MKDAIRKWVSAVILLNKWNAALFQNF